MNTRHPILSGTLAILALISCLGPVRAVQVGVWNFNNSLDNAIGGRDPMVVVGGWAPIYVNQTIAGSPATALSFPALTSSQALDMPNEAGPNGPAGLATRNNWSLVMDVRFDSPGDYTALWETADLGIGDADYFARALDGIGTLGQYSGEGTYDPTVWTRIGVTVDTTVDPGNYTVTGYVNGVQVGTANAGTAPAGKEAIREYLHLFTDNDFETSPGYLNSLAYYGEVLTSTAMGALGGSTAAGIPAASNQTGLWHFNDNLTNAVSGGAPMAAVGSWSPSYVTETIGGSSARVLAFPAFDGTQALDMPNEATPDDFGALSSTNNWTIVMDVNFPMLNPDGWASLWETDTIGTNDGDYFIRDDSETGLFGSIGTSNQYGGFFAADTWTRIAVTVDGSVNGAGYTLNSYIDGALVGTATTSTSPNGKESIEAFLHMFTDDDGEVAAGIINSLAFYNEVLSEAAIAALGGATAAGIPVTAPALDADFDNDGSVNGKDFLIWQRGFGITSGATNGQGDADGNGAVNAADLTVWRNLYPGASLTTAQVAVPEPTGWVLSVLVLLGAAPISRHRA